METMRLDGRTALCGQIPGYGVELLDYLGMLLDYLGMLHVMFPPVLLHVLG